MHVHDLIKFYVSKIYIRIIMIVTADSGYTPPRLLIVLISSNQFLNFSRCKVYSLQRFHEDISYHIVCRTIY